jgi:hypothetical protein
MGPPALVAIGIIRIGLVADVDGGVGLLAAVGIGQLISGLALGNPVVLPIAPALMGLEIRGDARQRVPGIVAPLGGKGLLVVLEMKKATLNFSSVAL